MKIRLRMGDNEGGALVTGSAEEARGDGHIHGVPWEFEGDLAYAVVVIDGANLAQTLEDEGYEVEVVE